MDHSILKRRLQMSFGIRGSALTWFESYLTDRQHTVVTGQYRSSPVTLRYGVPQGSMLGPVSFSLYAQPLIDIFDTHGFSYHIYADDSQLYRSTEVNNHQASPHDHINLLQHDHTSIKLPQHDRITIYLLQHNIINIDIPCND
ncbi:reverse transcriptase protein [Elysia marginata]|uniref:Reverse transcriptase protein n=1 Tax=Elysia marginata TaxID=1093978 RepID=A0AAV4JBT8_9GAST|nr:reverse transcriptase protein [Elysia marginata]